MVRRKLKRFDASTFRLISRPCRPTASLGSAPSCRRSKRAAPPSPASSTAIARSWGTLGLRPRSGAGLDRSCILAWRVDIGEGIKPAATSHGFDAYFFDVRFLPDDDA